MVGMLLKMGEWAVQTKQKDGGDESISQNGICMAHIHRHSKRLTEYNTVI